MAISSKTVWICSICSFNSRTTTSNSFFDSWSASFDAVVASFTLWINASAVSCVMNRWSLADCATRSSFTNSEVRKVVLSTSNCRWSSPSLILSSSSSKAFDGSSIGFCSSPFSGLLFSFQVCRPYVSLHYTCDFHRI